MRGFLFTFDFLQLSNENNFLTLPVEINLYDSSYLSVANQETNSTHKKQFIFILIYVYDHYS